MRIDQISSATDKRSLPFDAGGRWFTATITAGIVVSIVAVAGALFRSAGWLLVAAMALNALVGVYVLFRVRR